MSANELSTMNTTEVVLVSSGKTKSISLPVGPGGALLGSIYCLLPALALAVGFGGTASSVQLGKYQPFLLAASLLSVVQVTPGTSCVVVSGAARP